MARKKQKKKRTEHAPLSLTTRAIFGVMAAAIGVFAAIAPFGLAGLVGDTTTSVLLTLLGPAYILLPIALIATAVLLFTSWREAIPVSSAVGGVLLLLSALSFIGVILPNNAGLLAGLLATPLVSLFSLVGSLLLIIATGIIGAILLFRFEFSLDNSLPSFSLARFKKDKDTDEDTYETHTFSDDEEDDLEEETDDLEEEEAEPQVNVFTKNTDEVEEDTPQIHQYGEYTPPPLSLLGKDKGKPGVGDIKANANLIKRTLSNFGINVEMDEVSIGPTVTRYAIKPAEGVRLNKIVSLANNLELALAAHPVRIEAPIPGKSLVGIEVPNTAKATVGLAGLMSSPDWKKSDKTLLAGIGRDITGQPLFVNVAKMPHGLIAGATGSGKSVAIHTLITSLLYRNGPDQMRFIMVDPKRVELTLYNGIPHLLSPVITDPKKAILSLKWAAKEMDRRYDVLEQHGCRDIDSYHAQSKGAEDAETMPYIVIIIDELADIMQTYPRELEAGIVRLAQMSRAVGIHLVLSTQRPSVNVVTGLIKANIPSRMALQVASQVDSKTILDMVGAETLLGAGDMLYLSGEMSKPVRVQTAFISEEEVKKIVQYIKKHNAGDSTNINLSGEGGAPEKNDALGLAAMEADEDEDDLYSEAKQVVEEAGKASTSYLQRKLRVGYARAARLMDILEERGVIGPADGSKPRDVLTRGDTYEHEDEDERF